MEQLVGENHDHKRNWFRPSAFSDFLVLPSLRGYFAASAIHIKKMVHPFVFKLARSAQFLHWNLQFGAAGHRFPGYMFWPLSPKLTTQQGLASAPP